MPIEIKELIIKINVEEQSYLKRQEAAQVPSINKEALIEECIERVIAEIEYRLGD
jgi:hypothetical protein